MRRGVLSRQSVLDAPTVRAKQVRTARLSASLDQVEAARPHLSRSPAKVTRLSAVLDFLANDFEPVEVSWVYAETGAKLQDLKDLAEMGLVDLGEAEIWRDSLAGKEFVPFDPPQLTPDQQSVWDALDSILAAAGQSPSLLRRSPCSCTASPARARPKFTCAPWRRPWPASSGRWCWCPRSR